MVLRTPFLENIPRMGGGVAGRGKGYRCRWWWADVQLTPNHSDDCSVFCFPVMVLKTNDQKKMKQNEIQEQKNPSFCVEVSAKKCLRCVEFNLCANFWFTHETALIYRYG